MRLLGLDNSGWSGALHVLERSCSWILRWRLKERQHIWDLPKIMASLIFNSFFSTFNFIPTVHICSRLGLIFLSFLPYGDLEFR